MSILTVMSDFFKENKNTLAKTSSYYVVHIVVAAAVVYAVTHDLVAAMTLSLLEPTVQCFAYFFHEKVWGHVKLQKFRSLVKTVSYYGVHLGVAALVAYAVTRSWVVAFTLSLLEPTVQMFFFYFHEKIWDKKLKTKYRTIELHCMTTVTCMHKDTCMHPCEKAY